MGLIDLNIIIIYIFVFLKGIVSSENNKELSPSEQRSLNAEKKAAWRQARLKSLEQVIYYMLKSLNIYYF